MADSSTVLYSQAGALATITLNRPDVLNALSAELMVALRAAMERAAHDSSVRAILFNAAGRGFCAGADLAAASRSETSDSGKTLRERYHPVIECMRAMPKPIICAVNGVAAGAGMSLGLASDIVIAGKSASFLQAFAKIGLIPDAGSTWFLPRLVGEQRARALMMLAEKISADDALRYGMVWQVVDDAQLSATAIACADRLSQAPTQAIAMIKQAAGKSAGNSLTDQLELEAQLQSRASTTSDFAEGVAAFREKRAARFTGN